MWVKEFHGAREFGFRRDDNLAYVGRSQGKWWYAYVRANLDDAFKRLGQSGWSSEKDAIAAANEWLEEKGQVAA